MASPQRHWLNSLKQGITWFGKRLWQGLTWILWILTSLIQLCKRLKTFATNQPSVVVRVVLLVIFGSLAFTALAHSSHAFEANLEVEQLSFSTNQPGRLFLNSIYDLTELAIEGKQTLTLQGRFQSNVNPQFNQLRELSIELPNDRSLWKIAPASPNQSSELEIIGLRLESPTAVEQLRYTAANQNRLAFSLRAVKSPKSAFEPNQIDLYAGSQPLKLTLEKYRIPTLNLPNNSESDRPLELNFTPNLSELKLNLPDSASLSINLPDPETVDSTRWFWGNLPVENIKLYESDLTSDIGDVIDISTLIAGKIRMAQQELTLEPRQFILIQPPGIQKIRSLQIQSKKGLSLQVSGITKQIQAGLDPEFPISSLRSNWLTRLFPKDIVTAIISFCTAMVINLLSSLVGDLFKT